MTREGKVFPADEPVGVLAWFGRHPGFEGLSRSQTRRSPSFVAKQPDFAGVSALTEII